MSRPAYEVLNGAQWIELFFDSDEQIIGIQGVGEKTPYAYPVRHTATNAGQWLVSGLAFVKHYRIGSDVTRRYRAYEEDGILCVDLKTEPRLIGVSGNGRSSGEEEGA